MTGIATATQLLRRPAVAGAFYPATAGALESLVGELFSRAKSDATAVPAAAARGLLVPHAGLEYSGGVAAAGWSQLSAAGQDMTVVILGTNHSAAWLAGIGVWPRGAWLMPSGVIEVDEDLAAEVIELGDPFEFDTEAHLYEHSIEVQLPLLHHVNPHARIVPLAVSTGRGAAAVDAGRRVGALIAARARSDRPVVLAISSDMGHYPPARTCAHVTRALLPTITALDPGGLDRAEMRLVASELPNLFCGMCGIEPAIVGLSALSEMGCVTGTELASATSADADAGSGRCVGYLAARFD